MKVALIGFGKAGQSLCQAIVDDPEIKLIDVYDNGQDISLAPLSRSNRLRFFPCAFDFNDNYDLLVISSPDDTHGPLLIKAIKLGIDTFVEKPAVYNKLESQELRRALDYPNRGRFTTNTILRTAPFVQFFRDQILDNQLGEQLYFEAKYIYGRWEKIKNGWRGRIPEYSVILGGGIHLIDTICYLVNDFNGVCTNFKHRTNTEKNLDVNDIAVSLLTLSGGHKANISCIFASPTNHERTLDCYGERAWFQLAGEQIRVHENFKLMPHSAKSGQPSNKGLLLSEFITAKKQGWPLDSNQIFPTEEQVINIIDFCLD